MQTSNLDIEATDSVGSTHCQFFFTKLISKLKDTLQDFNFLGRSTFKLVSTDVYLLGLGKYSFKQIRGGRGHLIKKSKSTNISICQVICVRCTSSGLPLMSKYNNILSKVVMQKKMFDDHLKRIGKKCPRQKMTFCFFERSQAHLTIALRL